MELRDYLKILDPAAREALAAASATTLGYLYQLAGGHRLPSAHLCNRLEAASDGQVTREELRPDLFLRQSA